MTYQHLTAADQAKAIADIRATRPTPKQIVAAAELEHWRSVIGATLGINDQPDAFVAPSTAQAAAEHAALDALEG
jgi:hypothetical protein